MYFCVTNVSDLSFSNRKDIAAFVEFNSLDFRFDVNFDCLSPITEEEEG